MTENENVAAENVQNVKNNGQRGKARSGRKRQGQVITCAPGAACIVLFMPALVPVLTIVMHPDNQKPRKDPQ